MTNQYKKDSIDKTKLMIKIMQAYVDGKDVFSQHKGFTTWGKVGEIGYMRHQWDSRNENYRLDEGGEVTLLVGKEFDDRLSAEDHIGLQKRAFKEAKKILTGGDETMWNHYCTDQKGTVFTNFGEECSVCGCSKPLNLKIA